MPHDVFLSYASADRAAAEAVCAALEARGIACWMAPRDVKAGADWGEAILTAIGRAHAMVLVLSRHTAASPHVRNEVVTAVSQSLALVPVRIEPCQPGGALRLHLAGAHWLDAFPPPIERHADALAAGVRLALAADATIEMPRARAAALAAAARASPAAAAAPPLRPPAVAPPLPAPPPTAAGRGRAGRRSALLLVAALALAGGGVAAWTHAPDLRRMLGLGSPPAPAAPAARLVNAARETITRLHLTRAGAAPDAEDWLGRAQITPGNAVLLRPPEGQGCVFDIRAVYVGGGTEERPGVDLCAGPELRFVGSTVPGAASPR